MALDLHDRLNWQQACTLLGCKKTTLYVLVHAGVLTAYGVGKRCRWYSRAECQAYLRETEKKRIM